jgi:tetratricopeptide (TPR) repeat protein
MTTASTGGSLVGKIGSYLQIVTKDPSSTAFVPLAEAYRQAGLLDDALEAARMGTAKLPHFSPGFSTLGRILGQMGRIDESMSAYAKALSIDRQSQSALVGLARLHLILGERDQARKILKQAEVFHPDDEKISDMLNALDLPRPWAEIKLAAEREEDPDSKEIAPDEPSEPIPTATLAEIYVKQGLLDKAIRIYQDVLKQDPGNSNVLERIMQLQRQTDDQTDSTIEADTTQTGSPLAEQEPAVTELQEETVESPQLENEPRDQSPLAVLQRWLGVIKNGRANV